MTDTEMDGRTTEAPASEKKLHWQRVLVTGMVTVFAASVALRLASRSTSPRVSGWARATRKRMEDFYTTGGPR